MSYDLEIGVKVAGADVPIPLIEVFEDFSSAVEDIEVTNKLFD